MAHLSTGGEQDFHRADGSGTGCSVPWQQRAAWVEERPLLAVEARVFCLRCAWSGSAWRGDGAELYPHLAGHVDAGDVAGVDWAAGHRYGPSGGKRPRGKGFSLPPLRLRAGKAQETAGRAARAAEASRRSARRRARERAAAGNAAAGSAVSPV